MNKAARNRAYFTCASLAACFTVFSFRLSDIQVSKHDEYAALAARQHVTRQTIYARRGTIQDIHGETLAQDEPVRTVVADATLIEAKDRPEVAALLAGPLGMPESQIIEKLGREVYSQVAKRNLPSPYIVLKKEVPESAAEEINQRIAERNAADEQARKSAPKGGKKPSQNAAVKWRGIFFEQTANRVYPNDEMLCHVVGYVDHNSVGVQGVEKTMERFLHGTEGYRYIERDRMGKEIVPYRGDESEAHDGCNVRLTIDMGLQNIVETEIDAAVKEYRPISATIILMNPKTGDILALANRPNYNPNIQLGVPADHRRNRAITDMVEPGSTFKIVTTSAALSEKIVHPDTSVFCENGYFAAYKLHDHHPYADLTVHDILVKSSNIGVAKLAIQLGEQKFYEYVRNFGFGERTGVNLPGEIGGVVYPPHRWSKISISRMPMGQEVAATPLQVATAMCAIANGGLLMMPQIVHDVVDSHGKLVTEYCPQEIRRVATKQATDAVRAALIEVVSPRGTAALAQVPGFKAAGKTGTAQKADAEHHYDHEKYVVSFVGFMPADDPAFVALVLLDEAHAEHGKNYGGQVAGPVFSRIGEKAARYLGLTPTEPLLPLNNVAASQSNNFRDQ
jgi:cell division protein FtsI (penicillin-binding protein 3)/stage V sporulation protein D (sporulation-specific penicillin-binding protein)